LLTFCPPSHRINKLKFSEQFRPAFKQVFGRTVVCQTLEIAGAYTRSHGLNAITLDGDKYDRKGALTGGFHDVRRSRLDAVKALKAAQRREGELSAERAEVRQAIAQTDQEVTTRLGQTKVIEGRLRRLQDEQQPLVDAIIRAQEDEDRLKSKLARLDAQLTSHRADVRSLEKECEMWRKEMESAFQDSEGLSDEEEEEMKRLSAEADQRKKALVELSKEASDVSGPKTDHQSARQWLTFRSVPEQLERAKDLLEIELNENLRRRREELRARLDTLDTSGGQDDQNATGGEDLEARKKELKKLDKQIHGLNRRLDGKDTRRFVCVIAELTGLLTAAQRSSKRRRGSTRRSSRQRRSARRTNRSRLPTNATSTSKARASSGISPSVSSCCIARTSATRRFAISVSCRKRRSPRRRLRRKRCECLSSFSAPLTLEADPGRCFYSFSRSCAKSTKRSRLLRTSTRRRSSNTRRSRSSETSSLRGKKSSTSHKSRSSS
jgi:structural maintenance of chromosome 3 (chondroitin sulfate proteoglycan 6)